MPCPVHELLQGASLLPLSQCPGHSEPAPDTESAPRPPGLPPAPLRSNWHRCTSKCWRHLCPVLRLAQSVTVLCFSLVSLISSLHHCCSHWTVPMPLLVSSPSGASYESCQRRLPEAGPDEVLAASLPSFTPLLPGGHCRSLPVLPMPHISFFFLLLPFLLPKTLSLLPPRSSS